MLAGRAGVKRATVGATTFMAMVCILETAGGAASVASARVSAPSKSSRSAGWM